MLRATHEPTRSIVELAVWRESELVNRAACEKRAYEKGLTKEKAGDEVSTELVAFPPGGTPAVWIGADHDAKDVTAELDAFGAYIHKCLYFRFVTKAPVTYAA